MNEYTGRLDEVPDTHRPACPVCSTTMRRNHATGVWSCDLHGYVIQPVWKPVDGEDE